MAIELSPDISIGEPRIKEIPQILRVLQEAAVAAHVSIGIPESAARAHVTTPRFIGRTRHWEDVIGGAAGYTLLVARHSTRQVVGYGERWITPCGNTILEALYVEPESQERGIGTALLDELLPADLGGVDLLTPQGGTAAGFYASHGFRVSEDYAYTCPDGNSAPTTSVSNYPIPLVNMVRPAGVSGALLAAK